LAELAVTAALAAVVTAAVLPRGEEVAAVAWVDGDPILAERLQPLLGGLVAESGVTAAAGRAALLDALIDEELLVRHARRLGVGDDDPLIRRRLMQIVLEATGAGLGEPSATETADWYAAHITRWTSAGAVRFLQTLATDVAAQTDAAAFRMERREPPRLHDDRAWWSVEQLSDLYGPAFAAALIKAPVGELTGPLDSSLGRHVVLVEERRAAGPRTLADVAVAVEADWREARRRQAVAELLGRLRAEASIVLAETP
jgi:hypothetical protein